MGVVYAGHGVVEAEDRRSGGVWCGVHLCWNCGGVWLFLDVVDGVGTSAGVSVLRGGGCFDEHFIRFFFCHNFMKKLSNLKFL